MSIISGDTEGKRKLPPSNVADVARSLLEGLGLDRSVEPSRRDAVKAGWKSDVARRVLISERWVDR